MHTTTPGQRRLTSPDLGRRCDFRSVLVVTDLQRPTTSPWRGAANWRRSNLAAIGGRRQSRLRELLHGSTAWRLARACGADLLAVPVGPTPVPPFAPAQRVGAMG